jgi:hypothetical protein
MLFKQRKARLANWQTVREGDSAEEAFQKLRKKAAASLGIKEDE